MNILFVTDFYKPHIGGVEKLFASLAEKLVEKGNNITYITWKYDRNLASKEILNGVRIYRVSSPSRLFFSLFALPKIIRESKKADIIHTSTYSSAFGAWIAGKIAKKKVVITVHEVWGNLWMKLPFLSQAEKRAFRWFEKWLFKLNFDTYIAVSDFTEKKLIELGIPNHKITRIYNGIDYDLPQWNDPGLPFTFTYFGRTGASKGLDLLIEAAERLSESQPEIRFKFILSPQSKKVFNTVTRRIKEGPLQNATKIFSKLPYPTLINELQHSNCIVIPSYCEGFGFTAVEASAMGIPVISSAMGSLPEVVSGKVISMKELTASSLLNAMEAALCNQFEEIPLKKFTVEEFILKHISLYEMSLTPNAISNQSKTIQE
jgi:glycosyltransferase involved in cell wall biosynthesis